MTKLTVAKRKKKRKNPYYDLKNIGALGGVKRFQKASKTSNKHAKQWLSSQLAYTLHKPRRKRFPTRSYKTSGLNDVWQMDLMEMIPFARINRGYKYILTCIDIFSRYARAAPLKSKSGIDVATALGQLFRKQKPKKIQTDLGKEFYNVHVKKLLKNEEIEHYSVHSQFKAALVERFNRTLREKLNRWFTYSQKKLWYSVLSDIIETYNKTSHRAIFEMRPIDITKENQYEVWLKKNPSQTIHGGGSDGGSGGPKLLDNVRISNIRGDTFVRNFDQNWSDEVFKVVAIDTTEHPKMYTLSDIDDNVLQGRFYAPELQVVTPPKIYRIEKVIRSRGSGSKKEYLVKWLGYNSNHNSWVSNLYKQVIS